MAHATKIKRGGVYNSLAHDDRSQEHISNADVDRSKSHLNRDYLEQDERSAWQRYNDIMNREDVHCLNRADVNTLVSWVVTAPKDLDANTSDQFFDECMQFIKNRYCLGKDNLVSAVVHRDESNDHIHVKFVPLEADLKRGGFKVSAKECVNLEDLRSFHNDLDRRLEASYGKDYFPSVKTGIIAQQGHNKSVRELKERTMAEAKVIYDRIQNYKANEQARRDKLQSLDDEIALKQSKSAQVDVLLENSYKRLESANMDVQKAEERLRSLQAEVDSMERYLPVLDKGLKASVELSKLAKEVKQLSEQLKLEKPRQVVQQVGLRHKDFDSAIREAKARAEVAKQQRTPKPVEKLKTGMER